jgi:hypothetical protein
MRRFRKIAFGFYAVSLALILVLGLLYSFRTEFMLYHREAVGMPWQDVPGNMRVLLLALIHGVGVFALALGVTLAAILWFPFRRGEKWADWIMPAILLPVFTAVFWVAFDIAASTGAHTPWQGNVVAVVVTLGGAVFCVMDRRSKQSA